MMSTTTSDSAARGADAPQMSDPERLGFGKLAAWAGAGLSAGANFIVLGYLSLYATDTLGMAPTTIGTIVAIGTVFNAVFGLVAAWLVDRTPETRWGKARPYELAVPLLWVATGVLFAVPGEAGPLVKIAWVSVTFLMIKAVFTTLLGANDVLYMARAFPSRLVYAKLQTRAGIITSLGSVGVSISLPMLLQQAGKDPDAWRLYMGVFAIALGILGCSRGLFIKETVQTEHHAEPLSFAEIFAMLRSNRWIWPVALMFMSLQTVQGANVGGYYFRYVVGNLGMQGLVLSFGILLLPLLLVVPRLMKKMPVSQIILIGAALGTVGGIINLAAGANIPLLVVGGILTSAALLPVSYLQIVLVLDLATYNQSLGRRRLESTLGAVVAVCGSIGAAVAAALVGQILSSTGYDGSLAQQGDAALLAIRLIYGLSFTVPYLVILVVMLMFRHFETTILPGAQATVAEMQKDAMEKSSESARNDADPKQLPVLDPALDPTVAPTMTRSDDDRSTNSTPEEK